jgi:hypothetical protein
MIEYARCIYNAWANNKTAEYVAANRAEFLRLCSQLLYYTPEEIEARIKEEQWYNGQQANDQLGTTAGTPSHS